jgi:hypothetical protein
MLATIIGISPETGLSQGGGAPQVVYTAAPPVGACGYSQIRIVRTTGEIYGCVNAVWTLIQSSGSSSDWNELINKPTVFPPSDHAVEHEAGGGDELLLTPAQAGLGNVNNTSDADKPISDATQTALDGKVPTTRTVNGHALSSNVTIVKGDISLGNVDNTSDANKPVSSATQTALNGKVNTTTTVNGFALSSNVTISKGDIGLGNVDNTSDASKPVSTATQTALDGKVPTTRTVNGQALSANVTITATTLGLGNVDNTSDLNKPISTATQGAIDALNVFKGKGTYTAMLASSSVENDIWLLTDANTTGLCAGGGGSAKAICVRTADPGIFVSIIAGTGSAPPGPITTIYGDWTGGGATIVISDGDCSAGDDTSTVQTRFNSVANNGTIDFQNTTNPCDIGTAGVSLGGMTNVRITTSVTPPAAGTIRGAAAGLYTTAYSTILYVTTCTDCLIDKLKINANSTKGQGVFCHHCVDSSMQNLEVYAIDDDQTGIGVYAAIKCDDGSGNFIMANNVHDTDGINGMEGVRGIWAGVGGEYETNITISGNTVATVGHSGIVSESSHPIVTNNTISGVNIQGTGLKFIGRGAAADAIWDNNSINGTARGAGFQMDGSATHNPNVYVRNNTFSNISTEVGANFGAFYLSGSEGGGSYNVRFTGNILNSLKSIAGINNAHFILFQNNTIVTPTGCCGNQVAMEFANDNITLLNSGDADIQSPGCDACFNIFEDGVQLAFSGDYINVADFGAVGDGTTDDTGAIQDALDTCSAGETVAFPAHVYSTNVLTLPVGCNLFGIRGQSTLKARVAAQAAIVYADTNLSSTVENLVFDMNNMADTGLKIDGDVEGLVARYNVFKNGGPFGAIFLPSGVVESDRWTSIDHNIFLDINQGIFSYNKLTTAHVDWNYFDTFEQGISAGGCSDVIVGENTTLDHNTFIQGRRMAIEICGRSNNLSASHNYLTNWQPSLDPDNENYGACSASYPYMCDSMGISLAIGGTSVVASHNRIYRQAGTSWGIEYTVQGAASFADDNIIKEAGIALYDGACGDLGIPGNCDTIRANITNNIACGGNTTENTNAFANWDGTNTYYTACSNPSFPAEDPLPDPPFSIG